MDDLKRLFVETTKDSLLLALPCACAAFFCFGWLSGLGVVVGVVTGQVGLWMIIRFTKSITTHKKADRAGLTQYVLRYCMYGIVMVVFTCVHVPVLAMLAGFMCSKGALLMYSRKLRKEADDA